MNPTYVAILEKWGLVRHADGLLYVHLDTAFAQGVKRAEGVFLTPPQDIVDRIAEARIRDATDELIDAGATSAEIEKLTAVYLPPA